MKRRWYIGAAATLLFSCGCSSRNPDKVFNNLPSTSLFKRTLTADEVKPHPPKLVGFKFMASNGVATELQSVIRLEGKKYQCLTLEGKPNDNLQDRVRLALDKNIVGFKEFPVMAGRKNRAFVFAQTTPTGINAHTVIIEHPNPPISSTMPINLRPNERGVGPVTYTTLNYAFPPSQKSAELLFTEWNPEEPSRRMDFHVGSICEFPSRGVLIRDIQRIPDEQLKKRSYTKTIFPAWKVRLEFSQGVRGAMLDFGVPEYSGEYCRTESYANRYCCYVGTKGQPLKNRDIDRIQDQAHTESQIFEQVQRISFGPMSGVMPSKSGSGKNFQMDFYLNVNPKYVHQLSVSCRVPTAYVMKGIPLF